MYMELGGAHKSILLAVSMTLLATILNITTASTPLPEQVAHFMGASMDDHHHGDADDRHDGPDGPCHHSSVQCHCTHAPVMEAAVVTLVIPPAKCRVAELPTLSPADSLTVNDDLHVPRA